MAFHFQVLRAIIRAEVLMRLRKGSTAVLFVLLCIAAYMWIPAPDTGRAVMQIKDQRVLYNSAALGTATATLCSLLLGLFGYYMISSSIQKDVRSRTGFIIAATPVRSTQYLAGKFLGNALFLFAIAGGFMVACMGMQLIRGESPLEPHVFAWHYLLMMPPMIVYVAAVALVFESVRFLSGRFGDLVYFFLWSFTMALVAMDAEKNPTWSLFIDPSGFAFLLHGVRTATDSNSLSIGATEFNRSLPPYVWNGLTITAQGALNRITSLLFPLAFVWIAPLFFHRFDPVRLRSRAQKARKNWIGRANSMLKPIASRLIPNTALAARVPGALPRAILTETLLILQLNPLAMLGTATLILFGAIADYRTLQASMLPVVFVWLTLILAEPATREEKSGLTGLVFSAPETQRSFILWKFGAAALIAFSLTMIPFTRLLFFGAATAWSLLIGTFFIAACATALGYLSKNPKTFVVVFLLLIYISMNDAGRNPNLDFAGWHGKATLVVRIAYLGIAAGLLAAAQLFHLRKLKTA